MTSRASGRDFAVMAAESAAEAVGGGMAAAAAEG